MEYRLVMGWDEHQYVTACLDLEINPDCYTLLFIHRRWQIKHGQEEPRHCICDDCEQIYISIRDKIDKAQEGIWS